LPTARGFDTFYGLYNAAGDHVTHEEPCLLCSASQANTTYPNGTSTSNMTGYDLQSSGVNGNIVPDRSARGVYSTELFSAKAEQRVREHAANYGVGNDGTTSRPLFLFVSYQAVHAPLQAPQRFIDRCPAHVNTTHRLSIVFASVRMRACVLSVIHSVIIIHNLILLMVIGVFSVAW
jgi:arylsulfatase B/arylsulfatase I/J